MGGEMEAQDADTSSAVVVDVTMVRSEESRYGQDSTQTAEKAKAHSAAHLRLLPGNKAEARTVTRSANTGWACYAGCRRQEIWPWTLPPRPPLFLRKRTQAQTPR